MIDPNRPRLFRLFIGGAFWASAGTAAARVASVASMILVARYIGKANFGALTMVQSTVGMFQGVIGVGLGMTAARYVAATRIEDPARAGRIIGLSHITAAGIGVLLSIIVIGSSHWIARNVLAAESIETQLRLGTLLLITGAIASAQAGAINGMEGFRSLALANVAAGVLGAPLVVVAARFYGLSGAVVGLGGGGLLLVAFGELALHRTAEASHLRVSYRDAMSETGVLLRFGVPATLSAIVVGPINWLCATIIVNQPNGYGDVAVFNAANQFRNVILFLPTAIGAIVVPILTRMSGKSAPAERRRFLAWSVAMTAAVSTVVAAGIIVFAKPLISTYGRSFADGRMVLVYLALAGVVAATVNSVGLVIAAEDRMWWGFGLNAMWGLIVVSLTWLWRSQGALGMAKANLCSYACHTLFVSLFVATQLRQAEQR